MSDTQINGTPPTLGGSSTPGAGTTTRSGLTARSGTSPQGSSQDEPRRIHRRIARKNGRSGGVRSYRLRPERRPRQEAGRDVPVTALDLQEPDLRGLPPTRRAARADPEPGHERGAAEARVLRPCSGRHSLDRSRQFSPHRSARRTRTSLCSARRFRQLRRRGRTHDRRTPGARDADAG